MPPWCLQVLRYWNKQLKRASDRTASLKEAKTIIFSGKEKFLEFEFNLLDFEKSTTHQYAYKIEGFSDTWNYLTTNNFRIAYLPYGEYTLKIKGGSINKGWSKQELSLVIKVPKPFYLKTWFLILVIFLLGFLIWFLLKSRTQQLIKDRALLAQKVEERTAKIEADKAIIEAQAQQLKEVDQVKTNFFNNITHELRTPLSMILSPANQLAKRVDFAEKDQALIHNIRRNAQHLRDLTDELLDLSKVDAGSLTVEKKVVSVPSFLQNIIDNYKSFADYQQIEFYIYWSFEKNLSLALDAGKTQKILHNLLSNAFKFTPNRGTIKVFGSWGNQQLHLKVEDTGKGIALADQALIFDRYYQVQNQNKSLGLGGAGIGLAICQEYLKLIGGTIDIQSQLGKGTTFTVQIPAEKVESDQEEQLLANSNKLTSSQNEKHSASAPIVLTPNPKAPQLLIAEDNMELAQHLKTVLAPRYNIQLAPNGKEAWRTLQTASFDLVISDVMMPEMNGMELVAKIKNQSQSRQMPILMLTALTEANEKIKALRIGVDDYLNKPFLMEELEIRIENLIGRYKIRREGTALGEKTGFSADESWLLALEQLATERISDPGFTVRQLAETLNLSERSLFNRVKSLVGTTPGDYLREVRLNQARTLLEQKQYKTVSEVCYAVGFQKPSYFAQLFKKRFGHLPSKYFK